MEVGDGGRAGGVHAGDLRRRAPELREVVDRQGVSGLTCDGHQMQHRVGGAADRRHRAHGVLDGSTRDDAPGAHAGLDEPHDALAGVLSGAESGGVGGRDRRTAGQAQPHRLGRTAHGVRGPEVGARPTTRLAAVLQGHEGALVHLAALQQRDGVVGRGAVGGSPLELDAAFGRAADHHDGGHVEPGGRHEHAGHDLVAGAEQHEALEGVSTHHHLDGGGDDLPRRERVVGAEVVIGQAVTDAGHAELDGGPSGARHAALDGGGDRPQVRMSGDEGAVGVRDADDGARQRSVVMTHALVQRPLRAAEGPAQHLAGRGSHPTSGHPVTWGRRAPAYHRAGRRRARGRPSHAPVPAGPRAGRGAVLRRCTPARTGGSAVRVRRRLRKRGRLTHSVTNPCHKS
ncbi:MAG: hypothetical protein BWY94_00928 [Actinobacteria bacterium ADurb.BinA094]|nr:MAG: hypothetical protein BWY94_00928 [Actinobacteria bacterium ADurb.BinA094]